MSETDKMKIIVFKVVAYLNTSITRTFGGYTHGDTVREIKRYAINGEDLRGILTQKFLDTMSLNRDEAIDEARVAICEHVFELLNGGSPNEDMSYQGRSLSVGDVIAVNGVFYTVEHSGWRKLDEMPIFGAPHTAGGRGRR